MNDIYSFQSNELLTGITILSVLKVANSLEISKCMLIEPLLSYKCLRDYMKRANSNVRSIEELIVKQNITFTNFNKRFKDKLAISINSILLMSQLKLLIIENNKLVFNAENFNFSEKSLGKTAHNLIATKDSMANILMKEDASSLYLSLRIEL
ncbi:MAG: hypothetical protein K0S47_3306 [Herbinix sp.]|jgi:hypothetical protein|nr:hypothetical protein [Herbinix sp.]